MQAAQRIRRLQGFKAAHRLRPLLQCLQGQARTKTRRAEASATSHRSEMPYLQRANGAAEAQARQTGILWLLTLSKMLRHAPEIKQF